MERRLKLEPPISVEDNMGTDASWEHTHAPKWHRRHLCRSRRHREGTATVRSTSASTTKTRRRSGPRGRARPRITPKNRHLKRHASGASDVRRNFDEEFHSATGMEDVTKEQERMTDEQMKAKRRGNTQPVDGDAAKDDGCPDGQVYGRRRIEHQEVGCIRFECDEGADPKNPISIGGGGKASGCAR